MVLESKAIDREIEEIEKTGLYIKDNGNIDKIRPQYVRRKDTNDTIGRYIVLLPVEKADSCQHDSDTCTYFCD